MKFEILPGVGTKELVDHCFLKKWDSKFKNLTQSIHFSESLNEFSSLTLTEVELSSKIFLVVIVKFITKHKLPATLEIIPC